MRWIRQGKFLYLVLLLFFLSGAYEPTVHCQEPKKALVPLTVKGKKIQVEVARTEEEKARGLMFRQELGIDEGMLFVYGEEEFLTFWMKNTPLPLSIAFLDAKGRIVDIQDMEPFHLRAHTSSRRARYALEMNRGWFEKNGVRVGDLVQMPSSITK